MTRPLKFLPVAALLMSLTSRVFGQDDEWYQLGISGKYQEAAQALANKKDLSADQKIFLALCLSGAGKDEEAVKLAQLIVGDWAKEKDPSPFINPVMMLKEGTLTGKSKELPAMVAGEGTFKLSLKGATDTADVVVFYRKGSKQEEDAARLKAGAEVKGMLPAGVYSVGLIRRGAEHPGKLAVRASSDEVLLGEVAILPWQRDQLFSLNVPKLESVEVNVITPKDAGKDVVAFDIRCPAALKYELKVYVLSKDEGGKQSQRTGIWKMLGNGPSVTQFNYDGTAATGLTSSGTYEVEVVWSVSAINDSTHKWDEYKRAVLTQFRTGPK